MAKVVAVTGWNGRLGKVLVDNFRCVPFEANITNKVQIRSEVSRINPDVIINCAAYTNVDECESQENRLPALRVNCAGVANLRDEFLGQIIHISTDYIFNGKLGPYSEKSEPDPINWYGQTKLSGEERLLEYFCPGDVIVRTTVLYGGHKPDFAGTVLKKLQNGETVMIPRVLFGNPTHVVHLSEALKELIHLRKPPEIINISGLDWVSRYEFGLMLANKFGYNPNLVKPSMKAPGQAQRPRKAGLKTNLAKRLGLPIYSVYAGIELLFKEKAYAYGKRLSNL